VVHEDAFVFLADARRFGLGAFWHTYAGYGHAAPRAIAEVGNWLPLGWFMVYDVTVALACTGALAAFTFKTARPLLGEGWGAAVALAPTLAPAAWVGLGSTSYLQWFLIPAAFWAVTLGRGRGAVVVAALAALTTPLVVVVLPAAVLVRGRRCWRVGAVQSVVAGLAVQTAMVVAAPHSAAAVHRYGGIPVGSTTAAVFYGVLGSATTAPPGETFGLLMAVALVTCLVLCWDRRLPAALVGTGFLLFLLTTAIKGDPLVRYDAGAAMLVLSGGVVATSRLRSTLVRVALAAVCIATVAVGFPVGHERIGDADPWPTQVERVRAGCATGASEGFLSDGSDSGFWGRRPFPCHANRW
jgi:hypothetical protein